MKLKILSITLMFIFLSACSWATGIFQPTSVSEIAMPDLVVASINVGMIDPYGVCVDGYRIFTSILNQGSAPAKNVIAVEMSTGQTITVGRLDAGQKVDFSIPADPYQGRYIINVDPENLVVESNETNNNLSYLLPTPTPYVGCAPIATVETTPLPPPPVTPSPVSIDGLVYADVNRAEIMQAFSFGEPAPLLDATFAWFSPDGTQALFERSGDLWLAEPMDNPGGNITNTSERLEYSPQWLPASTPQKIIFNSVPSGPLTSPPSGFLSWMNLDGSGYEVLASTPSYTSPALDPGGQTIAYEEYGKPMNYAIGTGIHPFDPQTFGYQPATGARFTSPSWSPDGRWITWWVSEESGSFRKFDLVMFELSGAGGYKTLYSYTPLSGTEGWLPNPVWSPSGQWIAFQTRGETTPWDLWVMHQGGGIGQRFGLATAPVWSPDSQRLAYVQAQPRTSDLPPALSILEVPSWNMQQTNLPAGSYPVAWITTRSVHSGGFPIFTPPGDWLTFSNPNPPYEIHYPSNAVLEYYVEGLTIRLPIQPGTQMIEKTITIETHVDTVDGCYGSAPWEGTTLLNDLELKIRGGRQWESAAGGQNFRLAYYATYHKSFCFTIQTRMETRDDSTFNGNAPLPTPGPEDMDADILLQILSTLRVTY